MKRRSAGFTLLEVLVALVVLGTILAMLSQGFRLGLRGMAQYDRTVRMQAEREPIARVLRQLIERMNPGIYPNPPQVRGSETALAFTSELPDATAGGMIPADVRLEFDHGALVLWLTPHVAGVPFAPLPPPHRAVLLAGVERVRINYETKASSGAWFPVWAEPTLPATVRVIVEPSRTGQTWPPIIAEPRREQPEE